MQTHAAIVEAVAETLRGDVDESDEKSKENLNKLASLVGQIKDAAAGVEQLGHVNVSHAISTSHSSFPASLRCRHTVRLLLSLII